MPVQGKKRKVDQILRATVFFFSNTHDFSKVSIDAIAEKAGVSPTTIYNNFGTREHLVAETIKRISLESLESYREIIRSEKPFPEKFRLCLERKVRFTANLDWKVINSAVVQNEELAEFASGYLEKENEAILQELIESGRAQGYISSDRSNQVIVMYFQVLQASGSEFFRILDTAGAAPGIVDELMDIMLYGMIERKR